MSDINEQLTDLQARVEAIERALQRPIVTGLKYDDDTCSAEPVIESLIPAVGEQQEQRLGDSLSGIERYDLDGAGLNRHRCEPL